MEHWGTAVLQVLGGLLALYASCAVLQPMALGEESGTPSSTANAGDQRLRASEGREAFNLGVRTAIYSNLAQLLKSIRDPAWRVALCVPAPNRSYELFQQSLSDDMEKLLDLEFNAAEYNLSNEEKSAVRACRTSMEQYIDNFQLWKALSSQQK